MPADGDARNVQKPRTQQSENVGVDRDSEEPKGNDHTQNAGTHECVGGKPRSGQAMEVDNHRQRQPDLNEKGGHENFKHIQADARHRCHEERCQPRGKTKNERQCPDQQPQFDAELSRFRGHPYVFSEVAEFRQAPGERSRGRLEHRSGERTDHSDRQKRKLKARIEQLLGVEHNKNQGSGGNNIQQLGRSNAQCRKGSCRPPRAEPASAIR